MQVNVFRWFLPRAAANRTQINIDYTAYTTCFQTHTYHTYSHMPPTEQYCNHYSGTLCYQQKKIVKRTVLTQSIISMQAMC
jgi:hypothetical protein